MALLRGWLYSEQETIPWIISNLNHIILVIPESQKQIYDLGILDYITTFVTFNSLIKNTN